MTGLVDRGGVAARRRRRPVHERQQGQGGGRPRRRPAAGAGDCPRRHSPAGSELKIPGLSPFTTPNGDFYRIDTALIVPQVSTDGWRLRVHGMVDRELELDFADLLARPLVERDITLTCVSNEVGGDLAGNARWLGRAARPTCSTRGRRPTRDADMLLSRSKRRHDDRHAHRGGDGRPGRAARGRA